jgi:S1-C subfamily serine protease
VIAPGGLALAVPSNAIAEFLRRGTLPVMLGVTVRPVFLEDRRSIGLLVLEVSSGGAAEASSILIGDLLLGANGKRFRSVEDLSDAIDEAAVAGLITLQFRRGNHKSERRVSVRLEARRMEAA